MSQLIHSTAQHLSRPLRVKCHVRPNLTGFSGRQSSLHTSSHVSAQSPLSLSSPLAQIFRRTLIQTAATLSPPRDSRKGREGHSITEDDDYQQQPPDPTKPSQHATSASTQPRTTSPTSATTATAADPHSTASTQPATPASLPAAAGSHAYFRVPLSTSPYSSTTQSIHTGSSSAAGVLHAGQPLVDMATDLTEQFMRAVHLSEQTRFTKGIVLGVSLLALLSLVGYLFRDSVKTTTAEQVADVAVRSLADSDVKDQVNTLSQDVVHRLLTDQAVLTTALQFTQRVLNEPSTQTALLSLLQRVLADPKTLEWGREYSGRLVAQLTADEKVQRQVAELVKGALMQPDNREQLITLLRQTVNDERSMSELRRVGAQSAKDVMNEESVQRHMTEFMKGVLADSSLQQQAGDALWSAVRYSIRPTWGKANGSHDKEKVHSTAGKAAGAESAQPVGLSRPLSAPVTVEAESEALATAADGLRDAVLMRGGRLGTDSRAHSSDSHYSAPSPPDNQTSAPANASSPSYPTPSSPASSSSSSSSHPSAPSSYLPPAHAPFAVASVDEEDLTPTFTINVNPQRAQPA